MTASIIQAIALLAIPVAVHNALREQRISRWLSPVVVCLVIGICAGTFSPHLIARPVSTNIQDISIVLAIPLLLMSSHFVQWLPKARAVLFAFIISCTSVVVAVIIAFFVFRGKTEFAWLVSSMFLAGFTGTIANANAVGIAKNCPEDLLLLVNLGDMVTGAVYLIILTSVAHPLLSRILPGYRPFTRSADDATRTALSQEEGNGTEGEFGYLSRYRMKRFGLYMLPVLISLLILGLAMVLEQTLFPATGQQGNFIVLAITTLGIASSFIRPVRNLRSSYRIGQYLLLVFCLALGTLIDFNEALRASPLIFVYATLVMVIFILLNIGLAWLFKIDADTTIITSTAAIYGPPFIGQVAMAMKNKEIVFSGMIASMLGIAAGNFLGLGMAELLIRLM